VAVGEPVAAVSGEFSDALGLGFAISVKLGYARVAARRDLHAGRDDLGDAEQGTDGGDHLVSGRADDNDVMTCGVVLGQEFLGASVDVRGDLLGQVSSYDFAHLIC
jgi:hypothetical protein